jgi:hypothetical protein
MPKFFHSKDLDFIKTIAEEVVDYVVQQTITLFKVSVGESKTNLYGESIGKVYRQPANLMCIVNREVVTQNYDEFGPDSQNNVEFRFNRQRLRTHEIPKILTVNGTEVPADAIQNTLTGYPEIGDIILFDEYYYEINNVQENVLVGGAPSMYNPETNEFEDTNAQLVAIGFLVRRSQIQIEEKTY